MTRFLLSPDKFKGTADATAVAGIIAAGIRSALPTAETICLPVADGGEGTVDAAITAGFERHYTRVQGPVGQTVTATWGLRADTAVLEMARASGLSVLGAAFAPLEASSYGTGQLIEAALDAGARNIILGAGGSACTDGGAGMLIALGAGLLRDDSEPIALGGIGLGELARIELDTLDPRLAELTLTVASDVANPLLGDWGSAHTFAPQKGADPDQVEILEAGMAHYADIVEATTGRTVRNQAGAGAAGGVGFGAMAVLGATVVPGIDLILDLIGFDTELARADVVITGEGSLDAQSLGGKAPIGVAGRARRAGVPIIAVVGQSSVNAADAAKAGIGQILTLAELAGSVEAAIAQPRTYLYQAGIQIASAWELTG